MKIKSDLRDLLWRILRPTLIDAWELGHAAGWDDATKYVYMGKEFELHSDCTPNPYRKI
jgi:hypothetical protein